MKQLVQKSIRNQLISTVVLSLIALAVVAVIAALSSIPYFTAMFNGGTTLTPRQVTKYTLSDPLYFASITGENMYDTNFTYEHTTNGVKTDTEYFGALVVEDSLLLVRLPNEVDSTLTTYRGTLKPMTSEYEREIITPLENEVTSAEFLPVYLDVMDTAENWSWYLGAAVLIGIGLFSLYNLVRVIRFSADSSQHPMMKRLARFNQPVDMLLESVDRELPTGIRIGDVTLTQNWMVYRTRTNFELMSNRQIAWIYKYIVRTRYGKNFNTVIFDQHGIRLQIQDKEKRVDELLTNLVQHAPWAVRGYSNEINAAWNKDRAGFVRTVESQRMALMRNS